MIEFNGYLSGEAEKRFLKRSRQLAQNLCLVTFLLLTPAVIFFLLKAKIFSFFGVYLGCVALISLLLRIPKSKKARLAMVPKRIYVEEDHIVCIANTYTESRLIDDVTKVIDHGQFYELYFPFGQISEKFICQKNLLIKGTLEEFESMFGDKLQREE